MTLDWSDGDYSRTARRLEPISQLVVERLGSIRGARLLDVGCGTGNSALAAAKAGAIVTGIDPAAGLLEIAERRAADERLRVRFVRGDVGDAGALSGFDVVLSMFAVIFAPDAGAAVRNLLAAVRPGGTIALTSWVPTGAIIAAGDIVADALPPTDHPVDLWGDPDWVRALMIAEGAAEVTIDREAIVFRHDSPEAWFTEDETFHPFWRWARGQLSAEVWERVRSDSVAVLRAGNEDPSAFAGTCEYLIIRATR